MSKETGSAYGDQPRRRVLQAAIVAAYLFVAGVAAQFLFAGLALFESGSYWGNHESLGWWLGAPVIAIVILTPIARPGRNLTGLAVLLGVLYTVQVILPISGVRFISALHPFLGLVLFGISLDLGNALRRAFRATAAESGIEVAPPAISASESSTGGG